MNTEAQKATKIRRPPSTYCIHHKSETDIRVLRGNKIISRHATPEEAEAVLDAIFRKPAPANS